MTLDPPPFTVAVVLAAGVGSRMRSRIPKVLHPLCGRPMLGYVLDAAVAATGSRPLVVISPPTAQVREVFASSADFAVQAAPRGTADALAAALAVLPADVTELVVLSGDVPLVDARLVKELIAALRAPDVAVALITVDAHEPAALGRVIRDAGGSVTRIVEVREASAAELEVAEVNAGLYAFDAAWLRTRLPDVAPSAVTGEYHLPELVTLARADGRAVAAVRVDDDGTLAGINDRTLLAEAEQELRLRINERHLRAGVTMLDPTTTYLDATVELAEDVTIEPGVVMQGATRIGRDTRIRTGSQLVDAVVGERCVIWASVIESSVVEDGVRIGPFSHLRPGSYIESGAELGNFAEVKGSRVGARTRQHHFSYLGDAQVGADVNIGAGTITANYDGKRKHRTVIGDRAFIGSDTILRAPVTVGEGATTGAGSVVTHDVPPGATVIGIPAHLHQPRTVPEEDPTR